MLIKSRVGSFVADTTSMSKQPKSKTLSSTERLLLALAVLVLVVAVGVIGFAFIEKRSLLDSLYMTLITISTLGMKASSQAEISTGGKIWIIILVVVGIASAMIALTCIAGIVVEGHVRSILGRRKVNMKIASLSNHIIVCGYGRMGQFLCQSLRHRQTPLIAIDQDDHRTTQIEQDGFLYVLGEATDESTLCDAGIERARALVTVLPSDADNVFVTLVARDLNKELFIAARAEKTESKARLSHAGADKAICPHVIGATRLANILTRPGVADFIDFAAQGLDLEAEQYHVEPNSKLVGQSLRQANLPSQAGVLVVALKHLGGQTAFNPGPDTVIQADDIMIVTGQIGSMARLQQLCS